MQSLAKVAMALLHPAREEAGYDADLADRILAQASEALERLPVKDRAIPECLLHQMPSRRSRLTSRVSPYKGHVFFSDISGGLWSVKLEPKDRPVM
jgi:hypothetical protein